MPVFRFFNVTYNLFLCFYLHSIGLSNLAQINYINYQKSLDFLKTRLCLQPLTKVLSALLVPQCA